MSSYGDLLDLEHERGCHVVVVVEIGCNGNVYVENTLADMYANCQIMEEALRVFDGVIHQNKVSCTLLTGGLSQGYVLSFFLPKVFVSCFWSPDHDLFIFF